MASSLLRFACVFLFSISFVACHTPEPTADFVFKAVPIQPLVYEKLPLGKIKPKGWIKDQLQAQAAGLTGHVDEFCPVLKPADWEEYGEEDIELLYAYLNGLLSLAYLLEDDRLRAKTTPWVEKILASQQENGWFGPEKTQDRWPLAVALRAMTSYYEATEDPRALAFVQQYFLGVRRTPSDWMKKGTENRRAMELAVAGYWLYRQAPNPDILQTIARLQNNSFDWVGYFQSTSREPERKNGLPSPQEIASAIKFPALWFQYSGSRDPEHLAIVRQILDFLDQHHGQVGGGFALDEKVARNHPSAATELCTITELMYSLEQLIPIMGDPAMGDRLEMLAYNALPAAMTPDCWAYQCYQQSNQIHSSNATPIETFEKMIPNGYGIGADMPCCLGNVHQGMPTFVEHMWMKTQDGGLAAIAYGPNEVEWEVGGEKRVKILQQTAYPFQGEIQFHLELAEPTQFPLYFRIPAWAEGAKIHVNQIEEIAKPGSMHILEDEWENGQIIRLTFPMSVRTELRYNQALSLLRGPLYFSLRIDKEYQHIQPSDPHTASLSYLGSANWEISPTSPWKFALKGGEDLAESVQVNSNPIGMLPFADEGEAVFLPGGSAYSVWEQAAPVVLEMEAYGLPRWKLLGNSAGEPPISPVPASGPMQRIQLVPYGSARLRITEFPWTNDDI